MNQSVIKSPSPEPTKKNRELLIVALILLVAVLGPFSSDSYLPSLPAMTHALNSNTDTLKLTITLYLAGFSISQLIYGPLSDRFGRRRIILVGLIIGFIGSILCIIAPSIGWLLGARFIQGAGIGSSNALFRAVMRDTFNGARMSQIASYASMVFALAPACAPIAGGYIQTYFGWRANFIFLALLFAGVCFLIWRAMPETNQNLNPHAIKFRIIWQNYRILLTSKTFMGYVFCSGLIYAGIIAYSAVSPFLFQTVLKLTPVQYGWLAVAITLGMIVGFFTNGILVHRIAMDKVMLLGIILAMISGTSMFIVGLYGILNVASVIVPTFLFVIAAGLVFTNAMAGAFVPFAKMAGSAGAMYGCLQVLTTVFISAIAAKLHENNQLPLATIYTFLSISAFTLYYFCIHKKFDTQTVE